MIKKQAICIILILTFIASIINFALTAYLLSTTISKRDSGVFFKVQNSVVEVKAETNTVGTSYGSGVVVNKNGTIVTNAHVVTYSDFGETTVFETIYIRLIDEEDYRSVEIVKYDVNLDIAVLKLNCERQLTPIKIGNDLNLDYGQKVFAIGNMSNYGISITTGIVAIPHINVAYNNNTRNVIQCDLTISDGNSGGALVDAKGRLVGITTFRLKDQSNNIIYGISYCIPINAVMEYITK